MNTEQQLNNWCRRALIQTKLASFSLFTSSVRNFWVFQTAFWRDYFLDPLNEETLEMSLKGNDLVSRLRQFWYGC